MTRTSQSHPLQIAQVAAGPGMGKVGITFCPGKQQASAATGSWSRDLQLDVDAIAAWNGAAVVTLVEDQELRSLGVPALSDAVRSAHMVWYHLPIRDVSVPDDAFARVWLDAGAQLRAVVRDGFNVVIHCKGGLGRAGMIAARLLIELGMEAKEAVGSVRSVRPGAIETQAQLGYAMASRRVDDIAPDTSRAAIADRAVGAMLGLAIGDALGTSLEFTARDSKPRVTDLTGGGPFRLEPGQWTDDTAMALALMDSLLADPHLDETDLMDRFVSWHEDGTYSCTGRCFDIGITTRSALMHYKRTGDPAAGSTDPMSAGNGSLMRLAPVAICYWNDRERLRDVAARQSRTTHAAPQALDACAAYAEILADAIAGRPRSEVMAPRMTDHDDAVAAILSGSWREARRDAIRSSGYVVHSLEAALWSVGRTGSFADAVILAANLGEDADTVAAITGQLAGALYGASAIPERWKTKLAWSERMAEAAQELSAETSAVVIRVRPKIGR